jgi:hypothetical protein
MKVVHQRGKRKRKRTELRVGKRKEGRVMAVVSVACVVVHGDEQRKKGRVVKHFHLTPPLGLCDEQTHKPTALLFSSPSLHIHPHPHSLSHTLPL